MASETVRGPAILILHSDAHFRQHVMESLAPGFPVYESDSLEEVCDLAGAYDIRLVITDRYPLDLGAPMILVKFVEQEHLAAAIEGNRIARYLPAASVDAVGDATREVWESLQAADVSAGGCIETDELISVLSHDVSNLASALAGVFEFIISEEPDPESDEMSEFLAMGHHCSKDLLDAVGLVVDLYRLRAGTRRLSRANFGVNELIDYAIDRVSQRARDRGITLSHSLDVERAWGDVVLLRRATIALLVHAIRETPRDGVVTLKASLVQDAGKQMFAVSVTDGAGALFPRTARWPLSSLMPAFPCNGSRRGITLDEVGLAFCEMMAALQGGNAWIVSGEPAGNTLSYAIPFPDPGMPVA